MARISATKNRAYSIARHPQPTYFGALVGWLVRGHRRFRATQDQIVKRRRDRVSDPTIRF